jgi:hypothetical protein
MRRGGTARIAGMELVRCRRPEAAHADVYDGIAACDADRVLRTARVAGHLQKLKPQRRLFDGR